MRLFSLTLLLSIFVVNVQMIEDTIRVSSAATTTKTTTKRIITTTSTCTTTLQTTSKKITTSSSTRGTTSKTSIRPATTIDKSYINCYSCGGLDPACPQPFSGSDRHVRIVKSYTFYCKVCKFIIRPRNFLIRFLLTVLYILLLVSK